METKIKLLIGVCFLLLAAFLFQVGHNKSKFLGVGSTEIDSIEFASIKGIQGRWIDGVKINLPLENRTGRGVSMTIREENSFSHGIVYRAESGARIAGGAAPQWDVQAATAVATIVEHAEDRIWFVVPISVSNNDKGHHRWGYYAVLFSYDRWGHVRFHDAELMTGPTGIPMSVVKEDEATASYEVGIGQGTPTFSILTVERRGEDLVIRTDH
jgi:hypothetical protein